MTRPTLVVLTEHRAPYWDAASHNLESQFAVTNLFLFEKVKSKPWKATTSATHWEKLSLKQIFPLLRHDVVLIGGVYKAQFLIILVLCILCRKSVFLFADVPESKVRTKANILFKTFLYRYLTGFLISGKKGISIYQELYGIPRNRILYFPYAWDEVIPRFIPRSSKAVIKVFIANRFLPRKGYDDFVAALKILQDQNVLSSFSFDVAGTGPIAKRIKTQLAQFTQLDCTFHGWIEHHEYLRLLEDCDAYLHTSKFEPFGIPVMDALVRKKIVISSTGVMSALDFIVPAKNGLLYDSGDCNQLAMHLLSLREGSTCQDRFLTAIPPYVDYIIAFRKIVEETSRS